MMCLKPNRLSVYLAAAAARPFRLGTWDCGIFCADWCVVRWNVDPMHDVRGGYATMDELFARLGTRSLPMIFDRQLRRARGFRRTWQPQRGDIAMIKIGERDVCGAIVTTGYVVLGQGMGLSRVSFDRARLVAAWTRNA